MSQLPRRSGADVQLEFRLLGEIAVLADGSPLDIGGVRQRSVLALLLLQRDRAISTELLADRLWPDDQPLSSIKTVQVYVSRLRHALGAESGRLTSTSSGYRLTVADDEFDVARFERGLREAREALAAGDRATARATLDTALATWTGPALGDVANEQFARREADRLEELRLQAIEELYDMRIGEGSGRQAIAELRRLVADEPGRERLWRLLMLALYADGRQAEALEAYQDARRYLADELGLDPSPELQELERAILTQEAPRPVAAPPVPATSPAEADDAPTAVAPAASPTEAAARRTRRVVTVLRAGLVGSGTDDLDPEVLDALGRRSEERIRRAVERHGGIIDHVDQDGVTAVFGLTIAREDDALRAVRAAAELVLDQGATDGADRPALRVGVATGEVLTGPAAAHGTPVTGAPFQAATRLAEHAAGHEVLIADDTERLVRGATATEPVALDPADEASTASAYRVVAVTEGEAIERRTTTPFVGRATESDALAGAFERVVADGAPGLVTVIGAPGVGKSRLVAESLASIGERARILRSRCLPYGEGITYWPVRELVQAATGIEHGEQRDRALGKLAAIVGGNDRADLVRHGVASIMGLTDEPAPSEEISWAVRRFVESLADERPLVLVVDDMQWAEPVLFDLLDHVLDLGRGPILLIAIARPELAEVRPDWLARSSLALVRLEALVETDAATLLDHLAPELPPGELRSRILASAEGNPLFVEQFVAYASDEALAGRPTLDESTAVDLPIPPTIGALLAARLDRVPEAERRLLERASVVGRTFWTGALTELLPDSERRDVGGRLARLVRRDLIRTQRSDFADEDAYRFRHLLIRDAAYASLPKRDRSELHERFADWLGRFNQQRERETEVEEILGYHLEQAYRYRDELGPLDDEAVALGGRASTRLASAGRRALARSDFPAAANLLDRAARVLDERSEERAMLLVSAGEAYMEIGEFTTADDMLVQAAAVADDVGDRLVLTTANLVRLQLQFRSEATTSIDDVMREAQAGIKDLEAVDDPNALARAWRLMSLVYGVSGRYEACGHANEKAIEYARRAGDKVMEKRLYATASLVLVLGPTPAPRGIAECESLIQIGEGDRRGQAVTFGGLAHLRAMVGDFERARDDYQRGRAILEELGLRFDAALISIDSGPVELLAGDPVAAEAELRKDYEALDEMGERNYISTIAGLLAEALYRQDRFDDAQAYAASSEEVAAPSDFSSQYLWRGVKGKLLAREGAHAEGITLATSGVDQTRTSDDLEGQGNALMFLAEAQAAAGRDDDAVRSAAGARALFEAKGNVVSAARAAGFASPAKTHRAKVRGTGRRG
jgi:DNA-binding SARP family transcriptional activator